MNRCQEIKAFHQREERYQGLELEYLKSQVLKNEILDAFHSLSKETGLTPDIYENSFKNHADSIYIEFHDEYDRDGGEFFSSLLHKLGIDQCEAG